MGDISDDQPLVFTAAGDWPFPDLGKRIVPAGARVDIADDEQVCSEFDTDGGDLARFGAALSVSRAGDWLLDLDGTEVTATGTTRAVPEHLRDILLGVRAGLPLRRRRDLHRRRVIRIVIDADDALLGEVDDVWQRESGGADAPAAGVETRRLEVIGVDPAFGAAVARRLTAAGAQALDLPSPPRPGTVGDAVRRFLDAQRSEILRGDVRLRRGDDAIHPTRVAVRRVRSVLRVVEVFEPAAAGELDRELSWLSGVLGRVRDGDVLREHFSRTLAELPDEPWRADTVAAVGAALDRQEELARASLRATMAGRRYLAVLRTLRSWADDPPLLESAGQPVKRLTRYVRAADRTLAKRVAQAGDAESTHRARKSAKRARYVSEFAVEILGDAAAAAKIGDAAKQAKKLQTTLGDRQDAAMAAEFLAALVARGRGAGVTEPLSPAAAFGCGVAWVTERERASG